MTNYEKPVVEIITLNAQESVMNLTLTVSGEVDEWLED